MPRCQSQQQRPSQVAAPEGCLVLEESRLKQAAVTGVDDSILGSSPEVSPVARLEHQCTSTGPANTCKSCK